MNDQEAVVYSVFVGIDWADSKHDVCIQPTTSDERVFDVIPHRPEAVDVWVKDLHQRYGDHNTGAGGTGNFVRIPSWEYWRYSEDGLVAASLGHFDAEDYARQINAV